MAETKSPAWNSNELPVGRGQATPSTQPIRTPSTPPVSMAASTEQDIASGERAQIMPKAGPNEQPLRGQWVAPFILSPHNPRILYHGMNFLFRSWDRGDKFEKISPDLTYNDPDKKGDIPYQTISTISESPFELGLIYVGTDDGKVHVTHDGGKNWEEIMYGIAPNRWISRIVASQYDTEHRLHVAKRQAA